MANSKDKKCIDYDKNTDSYAFIRFDKFFKKRGRKVRVKTEDLTKDEINLLYDNFINHWNALPLKAQSMFMKWLREALQERQDKIDKQKAE